METNKKNKQLRIVFILLVLSIILSFYMLYTSFLWAYNEFIAIFLNDIESFYPEISVSRVLFERDFMFNLSWQFYLLIIFLVLCLICLYYFISSSYKSYSKDIHHIINEIEHDHFTPSTLEGEMSLLEEKIYTYKKRTDKLIEKNEIEKKQLSDYVENIAHQIKTPITSIRLNEEVAVMSNDVSILEKNNNSFERLDSLFEDFMKLARIENDTIHFNLEVGTMDELLEEIKEQITPILNNTNLIIESCDTKFYYDFQWLVEALYNIVKNCIEEGVSEIRIQAYYNSEMNHIIIRDNGKGIKEEDLPYIFNRFFRTQNSKKKGVGIGLSLTKEIVERHHGFISAYNEGGAVFDISFPVLDIKEKVI